jgi:hypothetical protein
MPICRNRVLAATFLAAAVLLISAPHASAQEEPERKPLREMFERVGAMRAEVTPQRAAPTEVQVIKAGEITAEPPQFTLRASEAQQGGGMTPGSQLAQPKIPPLDITVTPRDPAVFNRAYIHYDYPRSVYINNDRAYAEYSDQNMAGSFKYTLRLDKGKKYLVEVEADTDGGSGDVVHRLGGVESVHKVSLDMTNISRIVEPSETGWISGSLRKANSGGPSVYRVYSVSVTEMEQ